MWSGLVAMMMWIRERRAWRSASAARSTSSRGGGDDRPLDRAGDCANALEVSRGGDGEARLDHVHAESLELLAELGLLLGTQRDSRRLLAVSHRGVEDRDRAVLHVCSSSGLGTHYSCVSVGVCGVEGRVVASSPLEGENRNHDDDDEDRGKAQRSCEDAAAQGRLPQGRPSVQTARRPVNP